ncbi:hypothetical protein [Ralstonia pseudosolanacearum]
MTIQYFKSFLEGKLPYILLAMQIVCAELFVLMGVLSPLDVVFGIPMLVIPLLLLAGVCFEHVRRKFAISTLISVLVVVLAFLFTTNCICGDGMQSGMEEHGNVKPLRGIE